MKRKTYSEEFKLESVRQIESSGKTKAQLARDLDISESALHKWEKAFKEHGEQAFPGRGRLRPEEEEIRRLKRALREAEMERDILKKATAFFANQGR